MNDRWHEEGRYDGWREDDVMVEKEKEVKCEEDKWQKENNREKRIINEFIFYRINPAQLNKRSAYQ